MNCNHKFMTFGYDANGDYRICAKCNEKVYIKTNADQIRAMSNEGLARLISEHYKCYTCPQYKKCTKKGCMDSIIDWLRQEADK